MYPNSSGLIDAYYCNGPQIANDVVPGRIGGQQVGAPYANAYHNAVVDGDGLCATHCEMQSTGDGAVSCTANGVKWNAPITVWRGKIFQAESATLTSSGMIIADVHNSGGKRVGYISPTSSLRFSNVPAPAAGTVNVVIYYANGDPAGSPARYLNVKVNGGAPQQKAFPAGGDWGTVSQAVVSLSGFNLGSNNTVELMGDGVHAAPDVDWIEILATMATN
jgi:hypothetical protein